MSFHRHKYKILRETGILIDFGRNKVWTKECKVCGKKKLTFFF